LAIADCRLSIEKAVWRMGPLSIGNRESKIGNFHASRVGPHANDHQEDWDRFKAEEV
jgi:hypothetical protein